MGRSITASRFAEQDFLAFSAKLHDNLDALRQLLDTPGFGACVPRLGAELEYYIVDRHGKPALLNREIQAAVADQQLTLELNRYNLEYNFDVWPLANNAFTALENSVVEATARLARAAAVHDASVVPIGILPTLTEGDLGPAVMTREPRYEALSEILLAMRGGGFRIDISGSEHIRLERSDLTAEGACTSFQVHFSFPLDRFVDTWNAITLVTPLVLALSVNSPFLLGKRLWQETRVPLFKQATDSRRKGMPWHDLPRVELGYDWLRRSAYELFAQRVYLYPPLIPLCDDEDPQAVIDRGDLPALHELNLHNGTIWHWNRPVYSAEDDGHIRVELRALPAGPSACDMVANAAFHIGLAVGLQDDIEALIPAMPFNFVTRNFYQAAQHGLDARLVWPSRRQNRLWDKPAAQLALSLLDRARRGLVSLGVGSDEADRLLAVIEHRVSSGQTGSRWQLSGVEQLEQRMSRNEALRHMVACYCRNSHANLPVSRWESMS